MYIFSGPYFDGYSCPDPIITGVYVLNIVILVSYLPEISCDLWTDTLPPLHFRKLKTYVSNTVTSMANNSVISNYINKLQ